MYRRGKARLYALLGMETLLLGFLFLLLPAEVVHAQFGPLDPLVPCGREGTPPCQACHIGVLAQNIINFLIVISTFIATLLFAYAGFLYVTSAGDTGKVSKAHGIFRDVFIGFIIVLLAWLIVDTVMKTFYNEAKFGPWNKIGEEGGKCPTEPPADLSGFDPENNPEMGGGRPRPNGNGLVPQPGLRPTPTYPEGYVLDERTAAEKQLAEERLRKNLSDNCSRTDERCTIKFNKENCLPNQSYQDNPGGCTDLTGMDGGVHIVIIEAAEECGKQEKERTAGGQCLVMVTGGSELGHTSDSRGCASDVPSHCSGNKVDISATQADAVNRYVRNNTFFADGVCPDGRSGRIQKKNGSCWVNERDHWDVTRKLD